MSIQEFSLENEHLSLLMNAVCISLPLVKLRQQFVHHYPSIKNIIQPEDEDTHVHMAGSMAEGLPIQDKYGQLCSSDTDMILILDACKVYEDITDQIYEGDLDPTLHVLRLPDITCPGYTQLLILTTNSTETELRYFQEAYFLKNNIKGMSNEGFRSLSLEHFRVHGPAVRTDISLLDGISFFTTIGTLRSVNAADIEAHKPSSCNSRLDIVPCLKGKTWPSEAIEWTTRRRLFNWPSKELYDNIIKSGYLLAGVGCKGSTEQEFQWRVSFNEAELLLINSFNETHIHCIWLLKLLKNEISKVAEKNITSYTMKTLMFWCLEETSNEFWQSSNLLSCFCYCISKLKSYVEESFCPNYFIRKRDLFDSSEFTSSQQANALKCIDVYLVNPKGGIISLLPTYETYDMHKLKINSKTYFIEQWIRIKVVMECNLHFSSVHSLWHLYDGYNTNTSISKCKDALEKMVKISYAQPVIKILQNSIGVLHYIRLKKEKELHELTSVAGAGKQWLKYMKLSFGGDLTHTRLREATCLLDCNAMKECIIILRSVTDQKHIEYISQNYIKLIIQLEYATFQTFYQMTSREKIREIEIYNTVIKQDLINQDTYRTFKQFKQIKKEGHEVIAYKLFRLLWKQCWFDVTFMPAEVTILPKPAALELCSYKREKNISFHPISYAFLLEYLWHVKNDSDNADRMQVIEKMKIGVLLVPERQQPTGLNFIVYCCSLQEDYCTASKYLIKSFKLNPVKQNVAYLYIKYIINLFLSLSLMMTRC